MTWWKNSSSRNKNGGDGGERLFRNNGGSNGGEAGETGDLEWTTQTLDVFTTGSAMAGKLKEKGERRTGHRQARTHT